LVAGRTVSAEDPTVVSYDGSAPFNGVVLLGDDSVYSGVEASYPAALGGWAGAGKTAGRGGVPNGIYGFTDNGTGNGVVGSNSGAVGGSGAGVLGLAFTAETLAVSGVNTSGTAVSGVSHSTATTANGLYGEISSTSPGRFSAAVYGINMGTGLDGFGVVGAHQGSSSGVYGVSESGVGVFGFAGHGTGVVGNGVTGVTASGDTTGLYANGPTAVAANATGATGVAVSATATSSKPALEATNGGSGPAVLASHPGGVALQVQGAVKFNRSGVATIATGHSKVVVTFPHVVPSSIVLATLQQVVNGVLVAGVIVGTDRFTIVLNKATPGPIKVGWFVIG
jgi:hypothetical protein